MPCAHCIAVISAAPAGGPVTTALLQDLTRRLGELADVPVRPLADTASVAAAEMTITIPALAPPQAGPRAASPTAGAPMGVPPGAAVPGTPMGAPMARVAVRIPVRVTVYRAHGRVRLQLLTHDLAHDHGHQALGWLAGRLGLRPETHSSGDDEALIRRTMA